MRTIIVFNDNSAEAGNATEFALDMAKKVKADMLILNLVKQNQLKSAKTLAAIGGYTSEINTDTSETPDHLSGDIQSGNYSPSISDIEATTFSEKDICELVIRKNIWLMVKGIESQVSHELLCNIDVQSVLNHVGCPLLLIPNHYKKRHFENIAYAVDMRYCRTAVLKFLIELANAYQANLIVEHLSAKGLPPLDDKYALSLFDSEITSKLKYDNIYFNNIKERNINVAIGVIITSLRADLLALVNHRFHFEEIFGRAIKDCLPEHIPVPVIVFPL
jgi:hypothetical protein